MKRIYILSLVFCALAATTPIFAQIPSNFTPKGVKSSRFSLRLNDAQLDAGLQTVSVFALDDRAQLTANPHFEAMLNLVRFGATLESLLRNDNEPINDINTDKKFGRNGYNKTVLMAFLRYGFGESDDVKLQRHFFELGFSPGFYKQGNKGSHIHLEYQMNIAKTPYGAGGNSLDRAIDYEVFVGGRAGMDWSFSRSESEAGFFTYLNEELERIAAENAFTVAELVMLEDLLETSRVLLPKDVGGGAFHIGPVGGVRFSKKIIGPVRVFGSATAFYDIMDLVKNSGGGENKRSQHQANISLGVKVSIGGEGNQSVKFY